MMRGAWLVLGVLVAGCSLANQPTDPTEPVGATSSSSGAGGAEGGSGPGGDGGTGGVADPVCGNGAIEGDEACDDRGESAACDPDCTGADCGDGYRNVVADEKCDDGNLDLGDACSDECEPTVFDVDPDAGVLENTNVRADLGVTSIAGVEHFLVAWSHENVGVAPALFVRETVYGLAGDTPGPIDELVSTTDAVALGPSLASSPTGRAVIAWATTSVPPQVRYRVIEAGGEPVGAGDNAMPAPGAEPVGAVPQAAVNSLGEFCLTWLHDETSPTEDTARVRCLNPSGDLVASTQNYGQSFSPFGGFLPALMLFNHGEQFILGRFDAINGSHPLLGHRLFKNALPNGSSFTIIDIANPDHMGNGVTAPNGNYTISASYSGLFGQGAPEIRALTKPFAMNDTELADEALVTATHQKEAMTWLVRGVGARFLVVWQTETLATGCALKGRIFDGLLADGPQFDLVPPTTEFCFYHPRGIATAAGDLMLVWTQTEEASVAFQTRVRALIVPGLLAAPE